MRPFCVDNCIRVVWGTRGRSWFSTCVLQWSHFISGSSPAIHQSVKTRRSCPTGSWVCAAALAHQSRREWKEATRRAVCSDYQPLGPGFIPAWHSWSGTGQLCTSFHSSVNSAGASPGGSVVKTPPANAGDVGSVHGLGRSPGEGNGNPLQYSCLENLMDRGAWWATVHEVAKSRTRLRD